MNQASDQLPKAPRKTLRIKFCDFPGPANIDAIQRILCQYYVLQIEDESPDFVFYSVFGNEHLRHRDAVRIFFTGENVHPDFNLCDYAFGFDRMSFADRYYRCPNFMIYEEFQSLIRQPENTKKDQRQKFCNFIYSNSAAHPFRTELFHAIDQYKSVDSVGPYLNNTGIFRGSPSLGAEATEDKLAFQSECKFSIAVENSSSPGYTTEKLVHALIAGTIPIYWGDPDVETDFNSARIINCHRFSTVDEVVHRIREIDNDDTLYRSIIAQPIFPNGEIPQGLRLDALGRQLRQILDSPVAKARRRNMHVWGEIYESRRQMETQSHTLRSVFRRKIHSAKGRLLGSLKKTP